MAGEARSVVVRLTAETAQYIAEMQAAGARTVTSMATAEAATRRQSAAIDTLGNKAGKVGAAAALGLAAMGKAAVDWESQFAGVEKTVDGTTEQLADLEGELRGLAKTMPATHEEIAGVAEAAGQLGVATEDVTDFTETMVQLGETTNLTAEGAATSIAQMANIMGTAPDQIDNLGAALVAVGNAGASTESQIIQMSQSIAGAANIVGLTEAEVLGIANAIASIGIEVEAGGTSISRVLTDMGKATAQGGEDLDRFAAVAGVSAQEFATAFKETPAEALVSFVEGLGRINEAGGDVFTVLDELGLSDVRVSKALLGMAADSEKFAGSLELGSQAWAENTALTDEYGKRLDTTAAQVQIAWNEIKDAAIEGGAVLLPIISQAAGVVGDLASAFGSLPGPAQNAVTGLLGITAVLGGGLWFTAKVIGSVTSTRAAIADLGTTAPRTAGALRGLAKAGAALLVLEGISRIIDELDGAAAGAAPEVEALTTALIEASDTKFAEEFGGSIKDALDAIDTDPVTGLGLAIDDMAGKVPGATAVWRGFVTGFAGGGNLEVGRLEVERGTQAIGALDEALTGLVASGGPERAEQAFAALAEAQGLSAGEQDKLLGLLPDYSAALQKAGNDALLAAEGAASMEQSSDGLASLLQGPLTHGLDSAADGAGDLAGEMNSAADAADGLNTAMKQLTGFLDRAQAMRDYAESVKGLGKALEDGFQPKDVETVHAMGREIVSVAESLNNKPAQQRSFLKQAKEDLEAFAASNPKAKAAVDDLLKFVNRGLDALDNTTAEPTINPNDAPFRGKAAATQRRMDALHAFLMNPSLDLDDKAFQRAFGLTKADLEWLDRKTATPKVNADAGQALSVFAQVRAAIAGIRDKTVTITTIHSIRGSNRSATTNIPGVNPAGNADGGFHENGVRRFDRGGWGMDGRYYPREPMLVPGGANILWGEQETGWEAYISGKPSERERNIEILRMAADRLGVQLLQAQGGLLASTYARGGIGTAISSGPGSVATQIDSVFLTWEQVMTEELRARRRELKQRARDAEKLTEATKKQLDAAKEFHDGILQAAESLAQTVESKLTSDLFGEDATFESVIAGLKGDAAGASQYASAVAALKGRLGLDDDALQALLEQASPEQVIEWSRTLTAGQLDQYEQLFNAAQDARERAGLTAGGAVFGERRDAAAAEVRGLRKDLRKSREHEKRLEDKLDQVTDKLGKVRKAAAEDGPDRFASAIKRESGDSARRNAQKARESR